MQPTNDLNVTDTIPLITPAAIKEKLPMTVEANNTVVAARKVVQNILDGTDKRLLCVVGPCSIHDSKIALEYAAALKALANKVSDQIYLVMRVYFEKPRTSIGWKGLINDPDLDGTYKIEKGLMAARKILLDINQMGVPAGTEMLDPITPQYITDLIAWSAIGARTTESQTHREMASGLSMPVGFKNGTNGNLEVAINAMKSAIHSHHFVGIDKDSKVSIIQTKGNPYSHMVLRGGDRPNYDVVSVKETEDTLNQAKLRNDIMIDCSHDNSGKDPFKQEMVLQEVIHQIMNGNSSIMGIMIEGNLKSGNQAYRPNEPLEYGVSITDKCLDWENTSRIIEEARQELSKRK
ncbi:MAG: 3-deoxy-7-phosphoheptulonate synthase [SAR324 cluster bacterium]|nr:3-deoxy-7-phosphoheptulonate synthase [SAR324 cluster bacterium]